MDLGLSVVSKHRSCTHGIKVYRIIVQIVQQQQLENVQSSLLATAEDAAVQE